MSKRYFNIRFYEYDPTDGNAAQFDGRKRLSIATFEEVGMMKSGVYITKCIRIDSVGPSNFRRMMVGGGNMHQYKIGEEMYLRKHKKKVDYFPNLDVYFDVRYPNKTGYDGFRSFVVENESLSE